MGRIKVLHLMGSLRPSGMERMLVSAAPYFSDFGVDGLVVGQGTVHPFADQLRLAGYTVAEIPSLRSLRGMWAYAQLLRSYSPDVVHIHSESAFAVSTGVTKAATGVPIVRTIHNVFQPRGRARYSRQLQAFAADRFVSQFIAPSPDVAANERRFGRLAKVILNWVSDEYSFANSAGNPRFAVMVGNCSVIKNHELALRVLVKNGYSVAHHGSEQDASDEEIELLNVLADRGKLLARGTTAPLESLKEAGVFVMPSLREGMPVALAEALSAGVPCLVSDSPGLGWAKQTASVEHLPLVEERWDSALPVSGYVPLHGSHPVPDLSAPRGARDYRDVYLSVLGYEGSAESLGRDQP